MWELPLFPNSTVKLKLWELLQILEKNFLKRLKFEFQNQRLVL